MPYPSGSTPQVPSLSQEVVALFLNSSVETRYALTAITLLVVYTAYLIVSMSVSLSLRLVMGIIGLFRRGRGVVAEEVDGEEDNETEMVDEGDEAEDDDESEGEDESGEDTAVESEESGKSSDSDRSLLFSEPENGEESEAEPMNLGDDSEDEVDEEESDEDDSEGDEEEDSQELGNESNDSDEE